VVTTTEGIWVNSYRAKENFGVIPRSLAGGRPVEVPDRKFVDAVDLLHQGLGLATKVLARSANPHILRHHLLACVRLAAEQVVDIDAKNRGGGRHVSEIIDMDQVDEGNVNMG